MMVAVRNQRGGEDGKFHRETIHCVATAASGQGGVPRSLCCAPRKDRTWAGLSSS